MRAAVAFLALHEQDFVLRGFEDFDDFGNRRRVDPVLRIHEQLATGPDGLAGLVHLFHDAFVHQRFRHVFADRGLVAIASEIAGKRLFTNNVLSGLHGFDNH